MKYAIALVLGLLATTANAGSLNCTVTIKGPQGTIERELVANPKYKSPQLLAGLSVEIDQVRYIAWLYPNDIGGSTLDMWAGNILGDGSAQSDLGKSMTVFSGHTFLTFRNGKNRVSMTCSDPQSAYYQSIYPN